MTEELPIPSHGTRLKFQANNNRENCFLCEKVDDKNLSLVMTLELDKKVRSCAELLSDAKLLAKLSEGDLVATEAHYQLYNRLRLLQKDQPVIKSDNNIVYGTVLGEIVEYIYQCYEDESTIPVFQLSGLYQLFCNRLKSYDINSKCENKTRLKEKILVPELGEFKKGREVLLIFKANLGTAISDACYLTNEEEGLCLVKAATILPNQIFKVLNNDNIPIFLNDLDGELILNTLKSFFRMMLYGKKVKDVNIDSAHSKVASTISQLIFYNCLKNIVPTK
ncbi:uncharacterized protein LOC136080837 [Hydra vulgaris]|uniref:Uncharacterized protein LOC136080837 n=1 Tax=Hydra vulgaris TaxID=6087 RepID=A0ABM4BY73_HYDVU